MFYCVRLVVGKATVMICFKRNRAHIRLLHLTSDENSTIMLYALCRPLPPPEQQDLPVCPPLHSGSRLMCLPQSYQFPNLETTFCWLDIAHSSHHYFAFFPNPSSSGSGKGTTSKPLHSWAKRQGMLGIPFRVFPSHGSEGRGSRTAEASQHVQGQWKKEAYSHCMRS